jgi:hypothetical protein
LIAQLQEKPAGPNAGDILAVLGRQLETALKANRIPLALQIMVGVVRAEMQVTDATRRRQYSIALKRMYSKALLEGRSRSRRSSDGPRGGAAGVASRR